MRQDAVAAIIAEVEAATALMALVGSVRMEGTAEQLGDVLEYQIIADDEQEKWAPFTLQWNIWLQDPDNALDALALLRDVFSTDLPQSIGGLTMFVEYAGGQVLAAPDRDGFYGHALRFRYTPLRLRYHPAGAS